MTGTSLRTRSTLDAHLLLLLAVLIVSSPVLYAMLLATQDLNQYFLHDFTPGDSLGDNLKEALDHRLLRFIVNSLFVATIIALSKTVFGVVGALSLAYFDFRYKNLAFMLIMATLLLPQDALIIGLFRVVTRDLGLNNSYAAVVLPSLATAAGIFIMRQHFLRIPRSIAESAQLDGAGPLTFLRRILLPMSWNTVAALFLVQFLAAWNIYLWPLMVLRDRDKQVVQAGLRAIQVEGELFGIQPGTVMIAALLASVPPLIVFLALQKQYMSGAVLGAAK